MRIRSVRDARYVELVARLRRLRESQGLSQEEVARRLGRGQSYVSKVETCERRIDVVEALDLCTALGGRLETVTEGLRGRPGRGEGAP